MEQETQSGAELPAVRELPELAWAEPLPGGRSPARVYLARLGPGSRRTMAHALGVIAGVLRAGAGVDNLPWWQLSYPYVQAVRAVLGERYAAATANKMLAALKGVLQECWRLGLMEGDAYHRAIDVKGFRSRTLPAGRALSAGEMRALFKSCAMDAAAGRFRGARDAAMLAVLYGGGLRRAEASALEVNEVNLEAGELVVRRGKGNADRLVPLPKGARAAIAAWLEVRGAAPGALLLRTAKGGVLVRHGLTPDGVRQACAARAKRAGVGEFSPHDLRRTFISDLLDAGADVVAIQKLAGHAQVGTTARYDRRDAEAMRRALEMLQVPF